MNQSSLLPPLHVEEAPALPPHLILLTYDQAAVTLGVSKKTVENLCRAGSLPRVYISKGCPRIRFGDLTRYIEQVGSNPSPTSERK
jgi:excisionase family DNA binding protein